MRYMVFTQDELLSTGFDGPKSSDTTSLTKALNFWDQQGFDLLHVVQNTDLDASPMTYYLKERK